MSLDAFLRTAWDDHAERPQEVADRLGASLELVEAPEQVAPFVRLLTHVYGEHLGLWQPGVELLESLRRRSRLAASAAATRPIELGIATLRYGGGDATALDALSEEDQVSALATAASALAARDEFGRAAAAYSQALQTARRTPEPSAPAMRALATGGNNLAVALEGKRDRSASESEAMVSAARAALEYWQKVGTWLEEERAEYRLARCLLQAGEPRAAIESAERCADVCARNDAPPFERFFAHAVLALAHKAAGNAAAFEANRQAASGYLEQTSEDERPWCESDRKELEG